MIALENGKDRVKTALLLAAGTGSRLQPLTDDSPKCLTEINETTILERLICSLRACKFERLVVVVGISAAAIIGSVLLMPDTSYLPSGNKNLIFGLLFSPPGYSIEEYRQMASIVEDGDPTRSLRVIRRITGAIPS